MITLELIKACGDAFQFATPLLYAEQHGKKNYYILAAPHRLLHVVDEAQLALLEFLPATEVEPEVIGFLQGKGYDLERCPVK